MLVLGLDLGTTKSAAVLIDSETGRQTAHCSVKNNAGTGSQSVQAILDSAVYAVRGLPEEDRRKVCRIGITGQMHGVVCWGGKQDPVFENWQSNLAVDSGTLDKIHRLEGCTGLCSGYGFSTLAVPGFSRGFQHAGTVMDYFVSLLTETEHPVMESSNAASWGLWNFQLQDWDRRAIERLKIPAQILPHLVPDSFIVGRLCRKWANTFGIPEGTPVTVSIGDNPAAIIGTDGDLEHDLFLTIGTGAQLAFYTPNTEHVAYESFEKRPFPGGGILHVLAPLCGGKAIELLAGFVADVLKQFSCPVSMQAIYAKIGACESSGFSESLKISTHFMGERNFPSQRGTVENIGMENFSFHELCRAWHAGLLDSLLDCIPAALSASHSRIILNGNAVRNSPLLCQMIKARMPKYEILLPDTFEEAACGAALHTVKEVRPFLPTDIL